MKELSVEEKAKAYDNLLVKLQEAKVDNKVCDERYCCVIDDIVPELAESEDERIRKEIIDFVKNRGGFKGDWIAWLEKQGEQMPWSEEDEAIYYGVIETEQYMLDVVNGIKKFDVGNVSIKEDCTRELNWLRTLKDRVFPQPKQEWSEEDEKILNSLISSLARIGASTRTDSTSINYTFSKEIDWLKSLRPQSTWKPSKEQIHYLSWIANVKLGDSVVEQEVSKHLNELLEDLKKL